MKLNPGKLPPELLSQLLDGNEIADDRVLIAPAVGRDVCVIKMGERCLVAKTDPVTFATDRIGWYVVQVNANDLATVGARPRWFLVTVLLPEKGSDEQLVRTIWEDLRRALESVHCSLCGGHTEVTVGLDRPILVGQMLGEVQRSKLVDKSSARPGDRVLLTKGVPIEGTAIIAREKKDALAGAFPPRVIERAAGFLEDPGISVVREAMAACDAGGVHAMHDPTEGGLATGLWELAVATGLGLRAERQRIRILEPGGSFCAHLGLDPLGVISSGSLLLCVAPEQAARVQRAIEQCGVRCADIGEMRPAEDGIVLASPDGDRPMPTFPQDEIAKLWKDDSGGTGGGDRR